MDSNILYYLDKLQDSYVESFGIVNQFIEVVLRSDEFEEIKFFVDCKISTSDQTVLQHKKYFDQVDSDVSEIVMFIKANNKKIIGYKLTINSLIIFFSNNYDITFDLFQEYGEPLAISFKSSSQRTSLVFSNYGLTEISETKI